MKKNQIFKVIPDKEFVLKVLNIFGIKDFDDTRLFSRKNLQTQNTVEQLKEIEEDFKEYYINCKAQKYLTDLNEKRSITILRQILKEHGYKIKSREKYIEGHKILLYNVEPTTKKAVVIDNVVEF